MMTYPLQRLRLIAGAFALVLVSKFGYGQAPGAEITRNLNDNTVKSIYFDAQAHYEVNQMPEVTEKYLGIGGESNSLKPVRATNGRKGIVTYRYNQYLNNIKVEHAAVTAGTRDGYINYLSCNVYPYDHSLPTHASITEQQALGKAKAEVNADVYMWENEQQNQLLRKMTGNNDTSYLPKGALVYVEDLNARASNRKLHLAYAFDIFAQHPLSHQQVYVDAQDGHILFTNSLMHHTAATSATKYSGVVPFETANTGTGYILLDSNRGGGVYTMNINNDSDFTAATDFVSTSNTWPSSGADTQAIDVQWGMSKVYDYWLAEQGRHSWDDADGYLLSFVHYQSPTSGRGYNNASWTGNFMIYGDGTGVSAGGLDPLVSLDITAHEIGHGVCQATAGLIYSYESGAMNEGFSDCWGATIEHWADPSEMDAVAKQYWKIGEEAGAGTPFRSMDNPLLQNDPATYNGTNWVSASTCTSPDRSNDNCGVHTNSGVLNHWYYFLVQGGAGVNDLGTSYSVTGIGWTDAAAILYQAEQSLSPRDGYADCRVASINAARLIFGACSAQEQAVTNAWYAVGVGAAYTAGTVSYTININANRTSITVGQSVTFTATVAGSGSRTAPTYQWYLGGVAIPGATNSTYTSTTLTNGAVVTCDIAISHFCSGPSTIVSSPITITVTTGLSSLAAAIAPTISLLPNPNNGSFTIVGSAIASNNTKATITVRNTVGQIVYGYTTSAADGLNETLQLPAATPAGLYLLTVEYGGYTEVLKMVVNR